jgi:hypothetical protein
MGAAPFAGSSPAALDRNRRLDAGMRLVAFEFEVAVLERENIALVGVNPHLRGRVRRAGELGARLVEVVHVEVSVAERMDEVAGLKPGYLRHHLRQQRVAGDVERDAEKNVGAALIELAVQLSVRDEELE